MHKMNIVFHKISVQILLKIQFKVIWGMLWEMWRLKFLKQNFFLVQLRRYIILLIDWSCFIMGLMKSGINLLIKRWNRYNRCWIHVQIKNVKKLLGNKIYLMMASKRSNKKNKVIQVIFKKRISIRRQISKVNKISQIVLEVILIAFNV